ncbi:MAG: hypothetical protein DI629_02705 [Mesorhizobium amorphae]|nr:MAG: hypothetical protein DI629_02705 [Mesorhizobium amorphae]
MLDLPKDSALQAKWSPAPDWKTAALHRDGWTARPLAGLSRFLVSGDLDAARARIAPDATEVGLGAVATSLPVLARIAPDRALFVLENAPEIVPGWHDGVAVTPADSLYAAFALEGSLVREVLREATAAPLDGSSRSAALLFAGLPALLFRLNETVYIHLEAPLATALWRWLETRPD